MTPKKFFIVCFCLLMPLFCKAAQINFSPNITALGFNSSPTANLSKNYGEANLNLPANLFINDFLSIGAEYFIAYDYFNKKDDFYNKLNQAFISFDKDSFSLKAGRTFLDIGLDSVIYFGAYQDKDLKKPSYIDGVYGKFYNLSVLGGQFDNKDVYGAVLELWFAKAFYFLLKDNGFDLNFYGTAFDFEKESFALNFIAAFNNGKKTKKILWNTYEQKYDGYSLKGDIAFKNKSEVYDSKLIIGAEYLSPDKENHFGYQAINANYDRGFIFGNINDNISTLTYKLGLDLTPAAINNLTAQIKIYNYTASDKRLASRDIASELNISLQYIYENFTAKIIYGYLTAGNTFSSFATGYEDKAKINKIGFILSYQF